MTFTLKLNARNDVHLTTEILKRLNVGKDRVLKAEVRGHALILIPVDMEPRYSQEELAGLDKLHEDQKKEGFIRLKAAEDIEELFQ